MKISQFDVGHDDLIHDIAYDYYGERLVTCSSDQRVKLWDLDIENNNWKPNNSWKVYCLSNTDTFYLIIVRLMTHQ
jgi:nucleoporin SEH1